MGDRVQRWSSFWEEKEEGPRCSSSCSVSLAGAPGV